LNSLMMGTTISHYRIAENWAAAAGASCTREGHASRPVESQDAGIYRIDLSDGRIERIADLKGYCLTGIADSWIDLDVDAVAGLEYRRYLRARTGRELKASTWRRLLLNGAS
jgi:hypothetical protein